MHSRNMPLGKNIVYIAFQNRPCNENFKVKNCSCLSVYGPRLESTGYHHAMPEPKVLQEIRLAVLQVAKYLYRDPGRCYRCRDFRL